jgi:4-amino-4-deoxy-L-arabinose transferase-like glycosyltransferase
MDEKEAAALIREHWPIIVVLVGCFLIAAPMGTYTNWDAQLEFEAATNVLTHGFPYVTTGLLINQPPLGFYTAAPVFGAFGLSYQNGVWLATAFGLGCIVLVYALGTVLYGKKTGLVAAALFGFIPWHVYMSRIFLIDNQYLFLSLLFLTLGVLAVRRSSDKLLLMAGAVFALAFLTKLFAVFALIPLAFIIYFSLKDNAFKLSARRVLLFVLPSLVLQAVWFGGFANQNFFGVYFSSDFTHPVLVANPALGFLPIIFVKSAGWFLFIAGFFSLALALLYRKKLAAHLRLDLVCLGTIGAIMALDMLFVFGFHLTVPYVSAVKYNYVALPFFCLLAASVADKGWALIGGVDWGKKIHWVRPVFVGVGLVLVFASLVESTLFLNAWVGFVAFGVDSVTYYGFNVYSDSLGRDAVGQWHLAGLVLAAAALAVPPLVSLLKSRVNAKSAV